MLNLNKKQKQHLKRIVLALGLFIVLFVLQRVFPLENLINRPIGWLLPCLLWLALYVFIGYDVIAKAVRNLFNGQITDENLLMVVASFGAFLLGVYNSLTKAGAEGFDEAVAVLIFYQVGQFFERLATEKSRKSISDLLDIRPDYANLFKNGEVQTVMPDEVKTGDKIVIYPGEKIPLDCTVLSGESTIDNKALTGESLPVEVQENSALLSGGVNLTGEILCEVTKEFYDSTVYKILDLVENASDKKSKAENFIAKFAKYYTPIVIILALLTAIIPSFITKNWQTWVYRALSFLVVSCPCALVISVPMTFFVALGKASSKNVLIKGSNYVERLANANLFVFDKTGTLTKGEFEVDAVYPEERKDEILKLASIAEKNSSHPIAKSIVKAYGKQIEEGYILTNFAGYGVKAEKNGEVILCGNKNLLTKENITLPFDEDNAIYVAKNGVCVGYITVSDQVKSEVNRVIGSLLKENAQTIMLTGDTYKNAEKVAKACGVTTFKAELLPQDKVNEVEKMLANKKQKDVLCFIGDGINDAPVLSRSDIGIAMGGIGSDAAIEASDVVLMRDNLSDLVAAKKIAKKAISIVKQNIVFSIGVKLLILLLSLFGITNMWFSIFGDVGVAVIAILNALRLSSEK